jgi:chemotaxis protein methyltransferase CheR
MMKDDAGITMHEHKVNLVHARLQKRLRALQIQSFKEYCNFVEGSSGQAERKIMMNALTTNLTHFFREPHHFKHLLDVSLRPLIERVKSGKRVRVWSAGCSTGEEAYSIASIVHSICPDIERYNFKILASDIDSNVIRTGHTGIYDKSSVRKLPSKFRDRYFKQMDDPEKFVVSDELKSLVSFRLLNLNAPNWPMKGKFDIIFCRNTVIYFDEETQGEIWTKFKNQLNPSSYLYIGHSERVSGPSEKFFARAGMTVYKLEN